MYDSRRLVMRTWSRFFMRTSGSIAARSDGWYICFIGPNSSRRGASQEPETARRPLPVHRRCRRGDRPPPARLGRAEHEDSVGLRGAAGLVSPELRHLPARGDVVERDPGETVAFGLGGGLPDPRGKPDGAPDGPAAIELDIADDQDHDGVV